MDIRIPKSISVLICTYNGEKRLDATLQHLARQVVNADLSWEVILVDNNSTDSSFDTSCKVWEQFGKPVPLRTFRQSRPGKQHALELAYQEARGEFMCIVDDDNWLNPDYLQLGYELLRANLKIGILGGRNVGAFEVPEPAWFEDFKGAYAVGEPIMAVTGLSKPSAVGPVEGVLWGAGLFVRHSVWRQLRELNFESLFTGRVGEKQLTAGEDDELCYAARLLGYEVWYDQRLMLTHFMTAGRLKTDYLKKLFYDSALAYSRLSAYQRVLTDPAGTYQRPLPWVKDLLYMTKGLVQSSLSPSNWRAVMQQDQNRLLQFGRQLRVVLNFVNNFNSAQADYRRVAAFYARAKAYLQS